jgi:hypothetical protein
MQVMLFFSLTVKIISFPSCPAIEPVSRLEEQDGMHLMEKPLANSVCRFEMFCFHLVMLFWQGVEQG